MRLNYKRTLLVGFAFFLICLFWQAYDTLIPIILTNKFGMSQTVSGVVMALDNILALFLLPIFGAISDRTESKHGKRTPFIAIGTVVAALLFVLLSVSDAKQLTKLEDVTPANYEQSLSVIYDANPTVSIKTEQTDGLSLGDAVKNIFSSEDKKQLGDIISREDFLSIKMYEENGKDVTADYTNFVVPARNAYAWQQTAESPITLVFFILLLLGVLIAMGTFRSPAVALMPDVTPKPLRSKANAIINLMGSCGGILVLVLGIIFKTGNPKNVLMNYIPFFSVIAGIMIISLVIFLATVKERKWAAEVVDTDDIDEETGKEKRLSKSERRSLLFILASVALWYTAYNAVTSKYSVYASNVLSMDYNTTLILAQAAAIISYVPIGFISTKVGRKKAILAGIIMLSSAFFGAMFLTSSSSVIVMDILFCLAGIGWATINVNSYPMVVELSHGGNTGKFTGYYYTASMAAQVITPILSGVFLDMNMRTLFPYATIFALLSFITMLFVKHGDSKTNVSFEEVINNLGE